MRIRRIRLSNFEGVASSEVSLASTGMTIIEGPNEVGKSSLVRGVDLLFQFPHESRHARVLAACPVHADAGPEVEVELTTGGYHLVYSKRWHKKPETTLTILSPGHQSLAGREAHDRVKAILDETLDEALYQALRYIQGTQIGQGSVGSSTTLTGALDRAAAGGSADPDAESTLWDAVESERLRYVTPSGRPTQEREQVRTSLAEAEEHVIAIDRSIAGLESIGESYRNALAWLETNRTSRTAALAELNASRRAESEIAEFEATVATLAARTETAKLKEGEARRDSDERSALVESIGETEADCSKLAEAQARAEQKTTRAQDSLDVANRDLVDAGAERDGAADQLRLATKDLSYYRSVNSDRFYTSRLNGLSEARALEATATGVLDSIKVTTAARRVVDTAWSQLRDAQIALEVGSPTVTITALERVEIGVGDTTVDLAAGDVHALTVTGSTVVSVPERVSLAVTGGASGDDLRNRVDEARRKLDEVVERYGLDPKDPVDDLADQLTRRG
ncbi:MAG: AAA family ATPase, partial [Acidimicrobiales bacterium]